MSAPITERSATQLAAAIRRRELTSLQVVQAHVDLLRRTQSAINGVVADRYEAALADARKVDSRLVAGEADDQPLLGVPFTVKESIELRGMPNAAGVISRGDHRAPDTAPAVQRVINAGAIPLGVTNTSELTLSIEADNPLYGRTRNPYDLSRTAGGSSGGEGAVVGAGGAPFGIGSDIAGSIRIPALFCGVFGHKPSAGLIPVTGMFPPAPGQTGQLLSVGPIARHGEDLMPLLRVMAGPDGRDQTAEALALGDPDEVSIEGLTVTIVEDSSVRPLNQDLRDGRERAVGVLLANGARLRRVHLRDWRRGVLPYLATLQHVATVNGVQPGSTINLLTESGEHPTLGALLWDRHAHTFMTRISGALELMGESNDDDDPIQRRLISRGRRLGAELREVIGDGVLLHPAHPRPAPHHGRTVGRLWQLTPATMFNLAGVPATEVPLGLNEEGLPLGVQVAAAHGADHRSIAVARLLEKALGGWLPPAGL